MPDASLILYAAVGRLSTSFDESGETRIGTVANPYFDLLANTAAEFHGHVTSTPGEELIAEFTAPSHAVRAAVDMQRRFANAVANIVEETRPYLRIGLHDAGAEMAARVVKQATPGRILISRAIREAVLGDADVRCTWQGQLPDSRPEVKEDLFEVVWTESTTRAAVATTISSTKASVPVFTRFDILGELGRGGMGVVYKGRDRETGEFVALKVLRADLGESPTVMERFRNEVRLSRKITHKNICRIHDFHREGDLAYISMEFVEGESLRAVLDRKKHFTLEEGLSIARQICAGLREAHAQGVVHRDLKPQNIIMDATGKVTLMDFGIARSVESGNTLTVGIIGTPAYMAPEQAEGKTVDHRTDIYAAGLVFYEIFTGQAAFGGDTMVSVVMKQIMEAPRPPRELQASLPAGLEAVILRCLAKSPDQRFASIADVEAALGDLASPTLRLSVPTVAVPVLAPSAPDPSIATEHKATKKWWKTAAGITAMGCGLPVLLCCLTLIFIVVWSGGRKNKGRVEIPDEPSPAAVPGVNAPIPGLPDGIVNVPEIVRKAKETQVKAWTLQGDKFMQLKKYDKAVEIYELAVQANPDNQELKNKLAEARKAKANADNSQ